MAGGYDGQNFLTSVEIYSPGRDTWEDGVPLTSGRSGHASAVCYQPTDKMCQILAESQSSECSKRWFG